MRREIHNLSMLSFPSPPPTTTRRGIPPQTTGLISVIPKVNRLLRTLKLNWLLFSQISAHASGCVTSFIPPGFISYLEFYFDICEWHILPVRAWTPVLMLHLTNPCAKWKVLSLTKPKGKIYKTKSLGHYITLSQYLKWMKTLSCFLNSCF